MKISIPEIINQILAQSAMAAIINDEKCANLLGADHEQLLEVMVRREFMRLSLALAPYLDDIDPDENSRALSLTFSRPETEADRALASRLHTMLASSVLASISGMATLKEAAYYKDWSQSLLQGTLHQLEQQEKPGRMHGYRF